MTTSTNGVPVPDLSDDNNPPADLLAAANKIDSLYGKVVANTAALPVTGDFAGQRAWVTDILSVATWNGSAWVTTQTPWTAYTPTIVGTAAPTLDCRYIRHGGKLVTVEYSITLTATITALLSMTLPTPPAAAIRTYLGGAILNDTSVGTERHGYARLHTGGVVLFGYENATPIGALVNSGAPYVWAAADTILGTLTYREA